MRSLLIWRRLPGAAAVCLLVGCTGAKVESNRLPDYQAAAKRLFVIETLPSRDRFSMPAFEQQLVAAIEACSTAVEMFQSAPRAVTSLNLDHSQEVAESQAAAERISRFNPDAVLSLEQVYPGIDQTDSPIALVFRAVYRLSLRDVASGKTVWASQISLATGNTEAVPTLVRSIVDRLSADGLLRSCPAAKTSQAD